jgi:hypothetical protein
LGGGLGVCCDRDCGEGAGQQGGFGVRFHTVSFQGAWGGRGIAEIVYVNGNGEGGQYAVVPDLAGHSSGNSDSSRPVSATVQTCL